MNGLDHAADARPARGRRTSSSARVPVARKAQESLGLLRGYMARRHEPADFSWLFDDLAEYDELLSCHAGRALRDARVFEIGYGARPYRLIALRSMGIDAAGVDLEVPLLGGTPRELVSCYRANGAERALKSLVRRVAFDPRERAAFAAALRERGLTARVERRRMLVGDAAALELPDGGLDLVVSEEVFHAIEPASLERLVGSMKRWLRPGGIALIRPTVYTGITGGGLQDWSRWALRHPPRARRSEPWDHLRDRGFAPNTYLNGLWRRDYRRVFGTVFDVLEERVKFPDLGREHLTADVAAALRGIPEEELFSNTVLFVLRRRA